MTGATANRRRVTAPPGTARVLAGVRAGGRPAMLDEHLRTYGTLDLHGRDLIDVARSSRLRGRGGGGFPTGEKLAAVAAQNGRPVVVVNATEGEPASKKDRALIRLVPHLVLDGAAAAASAVGASEVVVALSRAAGDERRVLSAAMHERSERVDWRVGAVPEGFVAGEETALINALSGRPAKPTVKPPYPFERGLRGAPTLVQNAETLAHLALVARFGAKWFRSIGTESSPGTALVSLGGAVARPGVHEIAFGSTVSDLVRAAGGATEAHDAYLVGGYFGGWTRDAEVRLTAESLGAGVLIALPAGSCGLLESARVARYLAGATAGQCGPCVHGLAALASGLEVVARAGRGGDPRPQLERWAQRVIGRGACRHPDGAARFILSSLDVFADEVALHLRGRCSGRDRQALSVGRRR